MRAAGAMAHNNGLGRELMAGACGGGVKLGRLLRDQPIGSVAPSPHRGSTPG